MVLTPTTPENARMRALDILRNEHGLIRQFLDNLELAVEKMESEELPPREFFDKALQFARTFADDYHHIKEEHVMFVRLAQKNNGELDGQIDALRHQHERARDHLSTINGALDGYSAQQPIQVGQVLESVAAYVSVLRNHIHKEDHVFYPLVAKAMSDEEEEQLYLEFEKARKKAGRDVFEANHKLVVDMGSMLVHL